MFWTIFHRIIFGVRVAALIVLLIFLTLPIIRAPSQSLRNATLQLARSERIEKDALTLEYRPVSEHAQAISELQDTLPVWEQEQNALGGVNDPQVQLLLLQSSADYTPMTAALQKILADQSISVDPVQVSIIVAHEHDYATSLSQITTLIQQDQVNLTEQFFGVDLGLLVLCVGLTIWQVRRR